jgi:thioredoxin reductase
VARGGLLDNARQKGAFDVAIVGAGYAGLSSALLIGRYLVTAVIFDGGATRNSMTRRVHGYPGFENISPKMLVGKMRADVIKYRSVNMVRGRVNRIGRRGRYFAIMSGKKTFLAKYVIIATGVQDIKPSIKNFEKFDGDGAWHCPYCDGHETAGKKLAVIVSGEKPLSYAKGFLGWTQDITVFLHNCRLSKQELHDAARLGIKIVNETVRRIEGRRGRMPKQLICKTGRRYQADVIFYKLGYRVQNGLAEQLGCQLDDGYIKVDRKQQTTVKNIYAAGDIDTDRHFVVLAAAAGARAAVSIYEKLLKEAVAIKRMT